MSEKKNFWNSDAFIMMALFALSFVLHMLFSFPISKGTLINGDAMKYWKYSFQWVTEGRQLAYHYPPVYPLMLTPAYLFNDPNVAMRVINQIYSSTAIMFVYLIAKLFLSKKASIATALASFVLPYQFLSPSQTMSENVYFPLLLLTIWFVMRPYNSEKSTAKRRILNDVLLSAMIMSLYLTRYITLVIIPVFALVWLMKQIDNKYKFIEICSRALIILGTMFVLWLPWFFLCRSNGFTLKETMGFGIASKPDPAQLTKGRLLMVFIMYVAYFLILAAPVIFLMFKSLFTLDFKNLWCKFNRFMVLIYGMAAAFLVAVTRHSWRVAYNYPNFQRVMGRYLIYFPLLFILVALVTIAERRRREMKDNLITDIVLLAVSVGLTVLAYLVDVESLYYEIPETFATWKGAPDMYLVMYQNRTWLVVALIVIALSFVITKIKSDMFSKNRELGIVAIVVIGFAILMPGYYKYYCDKYHDLGVEYTEDLNAILTEANLTSDIKNLKVRIYYDLDNVHGDYEQYNLQYYRNNSQYKYMTKLTDMENEQGKYIVLVSEDEKSKYDDVFVRELGTYERFDETVAVLLLKNP